MEIVGSSVGAGTLALLGVCLLIALGFEFVNGFHDTANAVATVIYTKSLKPGVAVVWSGFMNFLGVLLGGTAVAFSIVHLLPVDLLINIGQTAGLLMVLSLLLSAILWNVGTWYFGLPASSSHALIGSILGVGVASSLISGRGFGSGVNWGKAEEIGLSLLISPLLGFGIAAILLLGMKFFIRDKRLYQEPDGEQPPPFWIRAILFLTCTGVSYFHGNNDGQKGVGLIMLILIGILPAQFALNTNFGPEKVQASIASVQRLETIVSRSEDAQYKPLGEELARVRVALQSGADLKSLPAETRTTVRQDLLRADVLLSKMDKAEGPQMTTAEREAFQKDQKQLRSMTDFVVGWVPILVALALGIGTTVGWKRIVVTVGEKIGKTHLTYAQGASAEIVAMAMIGVASWLGLPVSTTHVLSSGIAGTMAANRSGLQASTVRNIALAWVLTLPVTMLLAGTLVALTAGSSLRGTTIEPPTPQTHRVNRNVN
jgi:PiT family inorganic phosphate transporter